MDNKFRIAYLIDTISSDKAGTEKQLLNLIERLGNVPIVFCLQSSPWLGCNNMPCEVVCLGYRGFLDPSFPLVMARYLRKLKEYRIELVQTFFEDAMFVGWLGKILSNRSHALILSRRDLGLGSDEPNYHWLFKKIRPYVFRSSDGIAVNAEAIKNQLTTFEQVQPGKVTVIGNGIMCPDPPRELPALFRTYPADVWVGIAANLKPIKRIDVLLRALAVVETSEAKNVVRLAILGEGRLKADLTQLAAELGIADRVHFVGAVDNVSDYLYGFDIGVLCSDKEGLSNAILEYMACGLPVVATDAGGNGELVDQTNGACVPVEDHIALAQALTRLIDSSELRKEMGARSLEKVKRAFTWDQILPQWERYYQSFAKLAVADGQKEQYHA